MSVVFLVLSVLSVSPFAWGDEPCSSVADCPSDYVCDSGICRAQTCQPNTCGSSCGALYHDQTTCVANNCLASDCITTCNCKWKALGTPPGPGSCLCP
jgi:hypothetical protein